MAKKAKEKAKPKEKKEKSGGGGFQELLLNHGEKIGLGVVGAICLLCVVFGFVGKPSLPSGSTPEALQAAVGGKSGELAAIEPKPAPPAYWVPLADKIEEKVPVTALAVPQPLVIPLFPLQGVRVEPTYFKPEQLRVIAGRSPFSMGAPADPSAPAVAGAGDENKPPEGSTSKGEFYAVGTFLIPVGAQRAEYERAFADTLKMPGDERPGQDRPEYFRYVLERAEAGPGVADDQLQWIPLSEADNAKITVDDRDPVLNAKKAEWAETRAEIVPAAFTEPAMTYGAVPKNDEFVPWLPPRLPKATTQWSWNEVGHGVIAEMVKKYNDQAAAAESAAAPATPSAPATPDSGVVDPEEAMKKFADAQPYKMGRFWDFTVEPSKQYRYRVTLVLRNPNRGYTKQYLKDEALAVGEFRPAAPLDAADTKRPVSDPSHVVVVPGTSEIIVGGMVAEGEAGNKTGEEAANVIASVWENTAEAIADFEKEVAAIRVPRLKQPALAALETMKGVWANVDYVDATKDFRVFRGQFLGMKGVSQIPHPISGNVETLKNVRFNTGFTLIDMIGGKRPVKAGTAAAAATAAATMPPPAHYLLLDPAGNLVIRSEISDRAAFQRKAAAASQAPAEGDGSNPIDQLK